MIFIYSLYVAKTIIRGFLYMFPLPCRSSWVDIVLTEFALAYYNQNKDLGLLIHEEGYFLLW